MVRFFSLVDTPEHKEKFKKQYRIPGGVYIEHCRLGEWYERRPFEAVIIPMVAFIEGGMRIPMGRVTRDFLCLFRLCPTQCAPKMFRILDSVDVLNEKMGVNLAHHDVNWVYSF